MTRNNHWLYFIIVLLWSWIFWVPLAVSGKDVTAFPWFLILAAGGLGPPVSAIVLLYRYNDRTARSDYWKRVFDFRRIGGYWYLVIFLVPVVYSGLALFTGWLAGEPCPSFTAAKELLANPVGLLGFVFFILIYGPLPEELGWRGYALDGLQKRWSPLISSLILGVVWSVWHLPMFFMSGSLLAAAFPFNSISCWLAFGPGLLAESIIFTWIYNHTNRSILSAILFHLMINFVGEFLDMPLMFRNYQFIWLIVMVIPLVIIGKKNLSR